MQCQCEAHQFVQQAVLNNIQGAVTAGAIAGLLLLLFGFFICCTIHYNSKGDKDNANGCEIVICFIVVFCIIASLFGIDSLGDAIRYDKSPVILLQEYATGNGGYRTKKPQYLEAYYKVHPSDNRVTFSQSPLADMIRESNQKIDEMTTLIKSYEERNR